MRASERLGAAVAAAMVLSLFPLATISSDGALFLDAAMMIAVVGASGVLFRRLLPGELRAAFAQAAAGALAWLVFASAAGLTNPFALSRALSDALDWTLKSSAPMGPNLGVRVAATFAVGMLAFLADQLAVTYLQPAWTLLPVGLPYLIPALALPSLVSFGSLWWPAAGYLVILLTEAANRARILRFQAAGAPPGSLLLGGLALLLVAMPAAGIAGVLTPGLDDGRGAPFTGYGPVQMGDPSLDLRRNLQQPVDRRILSYTTSTGAPAQLRLTSLPAFDATGFHLNPIDLGSGALPAPPGAPSGRERYTINVAVDDFNSEWLPLPYAPSVFAAAGDWRHDPVSLSVLAAGRNQKEATNRLRYEATIVDVSPTGEQVAGASAGRPSDAAATAALPDDLPARIRELAQTVTRDADSDGGRALLIQNWLRSSRFTYSTAPAPGSGYEALTRFLFEDRSGYCEQFSTSMAVLARAVGIPSRVAVGFLSGRRTSNGWEVSIRDMHAWPELFFAGLGWVSFEPTPGVATPPGYASGSPTQEPSPSPSASAQQEPELEQPSVEPEAPEELPDVTEDEGVDLSWLPWAGGTVLLLAALGAAPWIVRGARRRRRLATRAPREAVTAAWDEVRDSVWDAGGEWPQGSARRIGGELAHELPEDAAAALGRVALLVERARYAETLGEVGDLSTDVERVRAGIAHGETGWRGWWRLLPRSLWRRLWWRG